MIRKATHDKIVAVIEAGHAAKLRSAEGDAARLRKELDELKREKKWNLRVGGRSFDFDNEKDARDAAATVRNQVAAERERVTVTVAGDVHYIDTDSIGSVVVAFGPPVVTSKPFALGGSYYPMFSPFSVF